MKTIYSLAVICVFALAQTTLDAKDVSPFELWSIEAQFVRVVGASSTLNAVKCIVYTIDQHVPLLITEKALISVAVDKIETCIKSGDREYDF